MRTLAVQTLVEVPLDDGSTWTGTEAQLRREHPTWVKYARIVQPTRTTSQDYDAEEDGEYDDPDPGRLPSSARRYAPLPGQKVRYEFRPEKTIPRRAHAAPPSSQRDTEDIPETRPKRQKRGFFHRPKHPLLYLGVGMIVMLALWQLGQAGLSWWQVHNDDSTYGRPRTFQLDGVFGHNDSASNPTHIIIVNLNRHVIVIELPGGDSSKARIYTVLTLYGDGQDLTPVTAKVEDVNGDGKPDLVLFIQDQRVALINDNGQFRPQKPGEQITIPK